MRVALDQLADCQPIRCFAGGNGGVLAHQLVSLFNSFRHLVSELPKDRNLSV
jgi:hypothetical protein